MRRTLWLMLLAAAVVPPGDAAAQETPSEREAPERLAVSVSDECGDTEAAETLRRALRARLPRTELLFDRDEELDVRLQWRGASDDRCELVLEGNPNTDDGPSSIRLASAAGETAIRNAASRVAWLLSARPGPAPEQEQRVAAEETDASDEATEPEADGPSASEPGAEREGDEASDSSSTDETSEGAGTEADPDAAAEDEPPASGESSSSTPEDQRPATEQLPTSNSEDESPATEETSSSTAEDETSDSDENPAESSSSGEELAALEEPTSDETSDTDEEADQKEPDETETEPKSEPREENEPAEDDSSEEPSSEDSKSSTDSPTERTSDEKQSREPFSYGTRVPARVTLLPLLSLPAGGPDDAVPYYAFNIIGHNYALRGIELGVFNSEKEYAQGVQLAVVGNWVAGPTSGFQTSGALNVSTGVMRGFSTSLAANVSGGLRGFQLAVAPGNLSVGDATGLQLSAGFNWTAGELSGAQVGAVNVAGDVKGIQSGLVNVGKDVGGMQLGLVNIAAKSDFSFGIVNVNWRRPAHIHAWTNELLVLSTGLQHGSRQFHNILRFGYRPPGDTAPPLVVPGAGLGTHIPIRLINTYLEFDALYNLVVPAAGNPNYDWTHWVQTRSTLGVPFGERISVYAGLSLNLMVPADATGGSQFVVPRNFPLAIPLPNGGRLWPGFFGGFRF